LRGGSGNRASLFASDEQHLGRRPSEGPIVESFKGLFNDKTRIGKEL
jgi:hypothetical protein